MRALVDLFVCNQYTKERWIVQFAKYTRKNFAFSIHFDIIYNHFVNIYSRILPKMQEKYFFLLRAKELLLQYKFSIITVSERWRKQHMYLSGLDDIDRKIIEILTHNARISYVDLAEQVGLSRVAVKARIQALEESGVIEEYCIIVDPTKIIGRTISTYFDIEVRPECFQQAVDILMGCEEVTKLYHLSGNSRLHVHAVTSSQEENETFINGVLYQLPGLVKLDTSVILKRYKDIIGLKL